MLDFAGNLSIEERRIERFNAGNTTATDQQRLPSLFRGVANGCYQADARDYDSAGNKRTLLPEFTRGEPTGPVPRQPGERNARRKLPMRSGRSDYRMPEAGAGMPRNPLFFLVFDVGDGVADRGDLFGVFVGDFQFESFFEGHDEFDDVEGVGAKVIDERCLVVNLALVHTQLLYDDLLDFLFDC